MRRAIILLVFLVLSGLSFGQKIDSTAKKQFIPNPKTASSLSALLPGAGQVYNRSYWKLIPIYAGIGAGLYLFSQERRSYRDLKDAYIFRYVDSTAVDPFPGQILSQNYLNTEIEAHRKRLELSVIVMVGIYAIQIVEAAVDAHLSSFDVSDNLSLKIRPNVQRFGNTHYASASLTLNFKK